MTATDQDLTIYSGDTAIITVTVTDSDNDNAAKDLTGCSVTYAIYKKRVVYLKKTSADGGGIEITDADAGELTITLDPADTANLPGGEYEHEVQITDAIGNVSTVAVGTLTIKEDIA